jgi:hypothetical protein
VVVERIISRQDESAINQKKKIEPKSAISTGIHVVRDLAAAQGYRMELRPATDAPSTDPAILDIIASIGDQTYATKIANKVRHARHHRFVIDIARTFTSSNRNASTRTRTRAVLADTSWNNPCT